MIQVMKETTSTYWVQACMFQKRDCVKNWNMTLTMYGYCLQLIPSSAVYSESKQKFENLKKCKKI